MKKFSNKKKIIVGSIIGVLIGTLFSITYAFFSYANTGVTSQLVAGEIYMKYAESSNTINFTNAMPRSTYVANQYFEFDIVGKNTNTEKDIIYDIVLNQGDASSDANRTIRIKDELLRFRLVTVSNNTETEIFNDRSYSSIVNTRIHTATISKNTTSVTTTKYRLYAWIAQETLIGNAPGADYLIEDWNKVYASVKVNVTGDFTEKEVQGVLYDVVKTGAVIDNNIDGNGTPIHFYEVNGTDNGNGKFVRNNTTSDQYPIYYYRGNVDNNNVIFANKCWKIVRTTETGGTKMIYNGEPGALYEQVTLPESSYTKDTTNTDSRWTFDSNDSSWNIEINDNSHPAIEFTVPAGTGYYMEMTGTSGSSCGGYYGFYKNGTNVNGATNGGANPMDLSYNFGTLTSTDKIKMNYTGASSSTCLITFKIKMTIDGEQITDAGCDNTGTASQLSSTTKYNSSLSSPAYVGYSLPASNQRYTYSIQNLNNNTNVYYGSSIDSTTKKLVNAVTELNDTHHYSYNSIDPNATGIDGDIGNVRYYYYKTATTGYYITFDKNKTISTILNEMLNDGSNTKDNPSTIQGVINTWYNTNIKTTYGSYVEDTVWCNDRSVSSANLGGWAPSGSLSSYLYFDVYKRYETPNGTNGIQTTDSPVLTCSNNDRLSVANGKLTNPVALLTIDEAAMAGLKYNATNTNNYLYTVNDYWLLSPSHFYRGNASVGFVRSGGVLYVNYVDTTNGVRPALSLKHGTLVYGGDGSVTSPYIVGTPRS